MNPGLQMQAEMTHLELGGHFGISIESGGAAESQRTRVSDAGGCPAAATGWDELARAQAGLARSRARIAILTNECDPSILAMLPEKVLFSKGN